MAPRDLAVLVEDIAQAFARADALRPVAVSQRATRTYKPGIGPHAENAAIALALEQLRQTPEYATVPIGQSLPYPNAARQKCDVWIGGPPEWAIEVKMARFFGDNGLPDPSAVKDVISPYPADRSALTDVEKLSESAFHCATAVLIYGFETTDRPLELAIRAFERRASDRVVLGKRCEAAFGPLVHPVHNDGRLYGWIVAR